MIITLVRDPGQPAPEQCTLGVLSVKGRSFYTMERPWIPTPNGPWGMPWSEELHQGSCIGVGSYRLESRYTEERGAHWQVVNPQLGVYRLPKDVPKTADGRALGRSQILIHIANYAHELRGCIAIGKSRTKVYGEWMVTESKNSMNELKLLLGGSFDNQLVIQ